VPLSGLFALEKYAMIKYRYIDDESDTGEVYGDDVY
jgi:hypothetical protein